MQLLGKDPQALVRAALRCEELGADIVDLNMGCPMPKITSKGKGASWMELNPDWHGKAPAKEEGEIAIAELEGRIDAEESKRRFEALKKGGK